MASQRRVVQCIDGGLLGWGVEPRAVDSVRQGEAADDGSGPKIATDIVGPSSTLAASGEVAQTFSQLRVVEDELFKALTAGERATLYGLLSRAVEALAPACEPAGCAAPEPAGCLGPEDDTLSG